MKIIFKTASVFLLVIVSLVFSVPNVFATVGGPTFIYNFKYNPSDESVYYINQDYGGRGCPPELVKISLNSEKTDIVYSCSEGEKLGPVGNGISSVNIEIEKITNDFKPLASINLKNNNISVDVNFVKEENYSPEVNEVVRRHFSASVYQNGLKIDEFKIMGCNLNQPFIFQGYAIPGLEKKIILLLSTRGDCFEGGYTDENLYVVNGVNNLDKTPLFNFYKDSSGLIPNEGNLVVFESEEVSSEIVKTSTLAEQQKFSITTLIIAAILSLLVGVIAGIASNKISSKAQ